MTTFIGIRGTAIQAVSSDPANPEQGQIWYNSSSGTLKGYQSIAGTWSSAPAISTARGGSFSAGTKNAAMISSGGPLGGGLDTTQTELYNGTSWTTSGAYPTALEAGSGCGTQTAALSFSGANNSGTPNTLSAKFNGTTWTAGNPVNTARRYSMSFGTQTAAIAAGGFSTDSSAVESYNGTSWTSLSSLPAVRGNGGAAGIQTAGILFGDRAISPIGSVLLYNGTSWTSATNMNTARFAQAGSGTQTAAVQFNGSTGLPTMLTTTEEWNGTSWFNSGNTANSKGFNMGSPSGTLTAALSIGGLGSALTAVATTESYTGTGLTTRTLTVS